MHNISSREKLTYTGSLLGQNMIYSFVTMYIMFFFTDLLRIPPESVTVIMVAASLWDAVNDVLMGMIADRTRTRIGKFRPYLLTGPVFIALATIFCFVSFGGSLGGTIAVAAVCYVLWDITYTVYDVPIWAISSVSSPNPDEKNGMVTLGKIGGTIGAALMILSGFVLKERIEPPPKDIPFSRNIHTILDNGPLIALLVSLLIVDMVNNLRQVSQMYFAVYVWGDSGYVTYIGVSLVLGMITGMAVSPMLIRRFDKKKIFIAACVAGAVSSFLPFPLNAGPVVGLILLGVSFAFTGMTTISSTAMLMDAIDYSEYRLGFRGEGIVFSMNTFLNKLSSTFSKGLLGFAMTVTHYEDNMEPTAAVVTGFGAMVYVVPALCFLFAILPLLLYRLKPAQIEEIQRQLTRRRQTKKENP